jgi:hypothetical protein
MKAEKTVKNGKDNKGRFTKGNSFGTGRPKHITTKIREMSNDYIDYIVILDKWARDESLNKKFRLQCITELLDRGVGKPTQHQQVEIDMPEPIKFVEKK